MLARLPVRAIIAEQCRVNVPLTGASGWHGVCPYIGRLRIIILRKIRQSFVCLNRDAIYINRDAVFIDYDVVYKNHDVV